MSVLKMECLGRILLVGLRIVVGREAHDSAEEIVEVRLIREVAGAYACL